MLRKGGDAVNAREFYITVRKMRKAQKEYFLRRTARALNESKTLEAVIDKEIERVEGIMRGEREQRLFPDECP